MKIVVHTQKKKTRTTRMVVTPKKKKKRKKRITCRIKARTLQLRRVNIVRLNRTEKPISCTHVQLMYRMITIMLAYLGYCIVAVFDVIYVMKMLEC